MWIFVIYDLPTGTKLERRNAAKFRKGLLRNGFNMFQFSIYLRYCHREEGAKPYKNNIKKYIPKNGRVSIFQIGDAQFEKMEIFLDKKMQQPISPPKQIEFF